MRTKFYIKNISEAKYNQPRSPLGLKSNAANRLFSLTIFYWGLKHEHVTDFNGRDRLLSHNLLRLFWGQQSMHIPWTYLSIKFRNVRTCSAVPLIAGKPICDLWRISSDFITWSRSLWLRIDKNMYFQCKTTGNTYSTVVWEITFSTTFKNWCNYAIAPCLRHNAELENCIKLFFDRLALIRLRQI